MTDHPHLVVEANYRAFEKWCARRSIPASAPGVIFIHATDPADTRVRLASLDGAEPHIVIVEPPSPEVAALLEGLR